MMVVTKSSYFVRMVSATDDRGIYYDSPTDSEPVDDDKLDALLL
jgi:hypothetical protein